jgi:hypothetical protein
MEHELFQSKLKCSVDGASVSDMIRSSSSGLHSYRTAAIELILERSIEERRERILAKGSLRSDPTPQPKRTSEAPNTPTPQVQSPAPAPAPQPPSQLLLDDTTRIVTGPASSSTKYERSQDSSAPPELAQILKEVARCTKLSADFETKLSPSKVFVELACEICNVNQQPRSFWLGDHCSLCPGGFWGPRLKCVGCGTIKSPGFDACTNCHGKFK